MYVNNLVCIPVTLIFPNKYSIIIITNICIQYRLSKRKNNTLKIRKKLIEQSKSEQFFVDYCKTKLTMHPRVGGGRRTPGPGTQVFVMYAYRRDHVCFLFHYIFQGPRREIIILNFPKFNAYLYCICLSEHVTCA